jgi:Domain of unknown function (DUF4440)
MPGATSAARSAARSIVLRRAILWGWVGAVVAAALIAVLVVGPKAQPRPPLPPAGAPVVAAADDTLSAAIRAGDKGIARRLLALEFTFVDATGKIHSRKDFLADLKAVAAGPATDVDVKIYGLVALVTGHHRSASGDDALFLDIWVRQKRAWRALAIQDVPLAAADAASAAVAPAAATNPSECKNPCETIPYRVRSPTEQEIVNSFQAIAKAVAAHDAGEWSKHVADDFVLYGSSGAPASKSARVALIERQKESKAAVTIGEVEHMEVSAYGDGAVMIATHVRPEARSRFRAVRLWTRRNGQWLMAVSAHTDIKSGD